MPDNKKEEKTVLFGTENGFPVKFSLEKTVWTRSNLIKSLCIKEGQRERERWGREKEQWKNV